MLDNAEVAAMKEESEPFADRSDEEEKKEE